MAPVGQCLSRLGPGDRRAANVNRTSQRVDHCRGRGYRRRVATWDEVEQLTWAQLEGLTWAQVEAFTGPQVEQYARDLWPLLRSLDAEERADLVTRFLDGTLPVLTAGSARPPRLYEVALQVWELLKPRDRQESIAMVALLVAIIGVAQDFDSDVPPPEIRIYIEKHVDKHTEINIEALTRRSSQAQIGETTRTRQGLADSASW